MSHRDAKGNENVIPAKAEIQKTKELDSRLHGNDGLEVFSGENSNAIKLKKDRIKVVKI